MNDKEHRNLERAGKADTDRILTIPNVLSFFRLALIPVIIVLYAKNEVWWAFGMLVLGLAVWVVRRSPLLLWLALINNKAGCQ